MLLAIDLEMGNPTFLSGVKGQLILIARKMRAEPTLAERRLWHHLRRLELSGFKFRRQHLIDRFIVDFYCPAAKLVIEVDGEIHKRQILSDKDRDNFLKELGYRVVRFSNHEVLSEIPKVLNRIRSLVVETTDENY